MGPETERADPVSHPSVPSGDRQKPRTGSLFPYPIFQLDSLWGTMIPPLLYLDRYRNEGTRAYSPHAGYTEAHQRFRPNSPVATFQIPAFQVPLEELNVYRADPDPILLTEYVSEGEASLCVHPQLMESHGKDPYLKKVLSLGGGQREITVSPSSSTRTLYVHEAHPPHALKLHFPFRISRYGRRMRDEVVEQAVGVSWELQEGIGSMDSRFAFLREVLGVSYRNLEPASARGENWGYLVREMTPFPSVSEERTLIPGFALYGGDFFDPDQPPLLRQLLKGRDQKSYILEQIMFPIIRHWVDGFRKFGLLLEPHGQNVLLEVGDNGDVLRIVHRDLNVGIDNRRRRELQIPLNPTNTYNQMETGEFSSITYDKFMGGHFFDPLVAALIQRNPSLRAEDFRNPCTQEFARVFPEHRVYLPRTVQYFSEERDRFGKPRFQDTGAAPSWRP